VSAEYLDSSAIVKLVRQEEHTQALREWISSRVSAGMELVICDLTHTETIRAARRTGDPSVVDRALEILDAEQLATLRITPEHFMEAGFVEPPELRTLDAIHLQAARLLGDDLVSVVTYDQRLAAAARTLGYAVTAPT
jgi:hypothetical protein